MKLLSTVALASVLVLGAASVVPTAPAVAQKKKKEEAPKVEISKEFRDAIVAGDTAAKAGDLATAETQLAAAEAVMKSEDEKYFAAQLRLQIANKKNDTQAMVRAIDALIASPKTQPAELARFNYVRGVTTLEAKQPAQALPFLLKARELGFQDPDLNLRIAGAKVDSGDLNGGIADIERAIAEREAAGQKAPEQWYRYAASKLQAAKSEGPLAEWLRRLVRAYPTNENWRTAINIYRTSGSRGVDDLDRNGRIELYRLMRATNALADQNDYLLYADAANNAGLRYETVSVIEEGRAAGKVPASTASANGLYTAAKQAIAREGSLATLEKEALAGKDGKLALLAANSYMGTKQFAKAVPLYRAALEKGGVDTAATTVSLGAALAQAGQAAEAKQVLGGVTDPMRKELAGFWSLYADTRAAPAATAPAATS